VHSFDIVWYMMSEYTRTPPECYCTSSGLGVNRNFQRLLSNVVSWLASPAQTICLWDACSPYINCHTWKIALNHLQVRRLWTKEWFIKYMIREATVDGRPGRSPAAQTTSNEVSFLKTWCFKISFVIFPSLGDNSSYEGAEVTDEWKH
jgi:hypothetical protein